MKLKLLVVSFLSCLAANAAAVQWTSGSGGNDHWYELVSSPNLDYTDAKSAAAALMLLGNNGHLATWSSIAEFNFIANSVVIGQTVYWYGAERAFAGGDPTTDWMWVNGEGAVPTSFTSTWFVDFFEGGPDAVFSWYNGGGNGGIVADYSQNQTAFVNGFVVEYENAPEPGTFFMAGATVLGLWARRYRTGTRRS